MAKGRERFAVGTLDECFESVQRGTASWRAADPKAARSLAKMLGAIAEQAIGLDERNPDRLRIYIEALGAAQAVRNEIMTPRDVAIARARMHSGRSPATALARTEAECWSPHDLALADASACGTPSEESVLREQLRSGTRAQFRVDQPGRMTLEIRLLSTLDVELPRLHAMSARQLVHVSTGRVLVDGGNLAPLASIDVPIGWYDVVLCTFRGEPRVLILLASTERCSHESPFVDFVPTIGLLDEQDGP